MVVEYSNFANSRVDKQWKSFRLHFSSFRFFASQLAAAAIIFFSENKRRQKPLVAAGRYFGGKMIWRLHHAARRNIDKG